MKNLQIAALALGLMVPALAVADDGPELAKGTQKTKAPTAQTAKPATRSVQPLGPEARWPEAIKAMFAACR